MKNRILLPLLLLLLFILGFLAARYFYVEKRPGGNVEENAQVLLERIRKVAKLVTVEGYFTEVYDYKDYWGYDLPFLRKKALLRVKARVSVGYDLERMKIDLRPERRLLIISNIPDPEIISIDHDIDYYDISQGTFNSFSEADYNRLNARAKEYIEARALDSDLMEQAAEQGNQLLEVIEFMAKSAGYEVQYLENTAIYDLVN